MHSGLKADIGIFWKFRNKKSISSSKILISLAIKVPFELCLYHILIESYALFELRLLSEIRMVALRRLFSKDIKLVRFAPIFLWGLWNINVFAK